MKNFDFKNVKNENSILEYLRLNMEDDIKNYCKFMHSVIESVGSDLELMQNGLISLRTLEIRNNNRQYFLKVSDSAIKARKYINDTVASYISQLVPMLNPTDDPRCWTHGYCPKQQAQLFQIKGLSWRNIYRIEERLMKAGVLEKTRDGKRILDLDRYEEIVSID